MLATKSRRSFASAAPHSYAPLRSTDSAAFDAVLKLFPAANDSQSTPRTSSSHPSSRSLRPPRSSSHSTPLEDDLPPSFLFALDPFKDVPLPVEDEQEEDVEEEAEDEVEDDDDDVSFTRSPFLAPTPSRLSTASSSSSVSARSRRQSGGRPSVSPAQSRSAVSKKLDLTDEDTTQGEAPSSASGRRSSRRSTQGLSVAFAADDDEPPSAGSNRRRSRVSGKEEKETDEQKEEMEDDETKEAPPEADDAGAEMDLEAKYDGDADGDDEADAGDAPMDFNDAGDDDNAAVNGAEQEDDEEEAAAAPSPHKAAPRRPRTQGKSRRETTRLVDEAKRVGMLDDEEATGFGGRRGRPKRHRIEPLRYWENEHITYERTQGGVGNVMPVPKDVVRSSYTSPVSGETPTTTKLETQRWTRY